MVHKNLRVSGINRLTNVFDLQVLVHLQHSCSQKFSAGVFNINEVTKQLVKVVDANAARKVQNWGKNRF